MPLDEGCAGDEWDVVELDDLEGFWLDAGLLVEQSLYKPSI